MTIQWSSRETERESKARSKAGETISIAAPQHLQYHQKGERERGEKLLILISVAAPQHLQYHQKGERERGEKLVIFISVAAPQHLQCHQREERERRKAGDTYKRCGTATPTIPSEGRERKEKSW